MPTDTYAFSRNIEGARHHLTAGSFALAQGSRRDGLGHLGLAVRYVRACRQTTDPARIAQAERVMESINTLLTEHGYSRVDAPEFEVVR